MAKVKNWHLQREMDYPYEGARPKKQWAIIFDLNKCIACQTCTLACIAGPTGRSPRGGCSSPSPTVDNDRWGSRRWKTRIRRSVQAQLLHWGSFAIHGPLSRSSRR